jgi:L-fucose isomerase-like protein
MQTTTFGVIVGNRGFFPAALCKEGRAHMLDVLAQQGYGCVSLDPQATQFNGAIESYADAKACAELLRAHAKEIDGVIITLPNFGDERAIANALRLADLNVPVLIHAYPDDADKMSAAHRRDSFCGKMSTANNLRQYGIAYSLTTRHTCRPESQEFLEDLARFAAVCRIVRRLRRARVGMIGARPAAFNTVRFSEKLLENAGISVVTIDLSEILGQCAALADADAAVQSKHTALTHYVKTKAVPGAALLKMAKLGVVIDRFVAENELVGTAIQCWTSLEENFGVVPCTLMSMSSNALVPSACETDVCGLLGMLALQSATQSCSALVDWNNNYQDDPDKCIVFHCSNLPKDMFNDPRMEYQAIIAGAVGKDNTYGTIEGRLAPGPVTFCRVSTDDRRGTITAYTGEGTFTNDALKTFGGYGVMQIPRLQALLRFICTSGFEHHVALSRGSMADAINEAFTTYLGWDTYRHV